MNVTGAATCARASEWTVSPGPSPTTGRTSQGHQAQDRAGTGPRPGRHVELPRRQQNGTSASALQPGPDRRTPQPRSRSSPSGRGEDPQHGHRDARSTASPPRRRASSRRTPVPPRVRHRRRTRHGHRDGRRRPEALQGRAGHAGDLLRAQPQFSVPQYEFAHQSATISNDTRSVTLWRHCRTATPRPTCSSAARRTSSRRSPRTAPATATRSSAATPAPARVRRARWAGTTAAARAATPRRSHRCRSVTARSSCT